MRNNLSVQINVRCAEGLRQRLAAVAAENRRSVNSEILVRLERDLAREAVELGGDRGAAA